MATNRALCILLDHVYEIWKRPTKYACWADFFPSILVNERSANDVSQEQAIKHADSKCSRYQKRELRLLRKELETVGLATIGASGVNLPKPSPGIDARLYQIAWYVRWVVRAPNSQYRECLLNLSAYESPFDDNFTESFVTGLKQDFNASPDETNRFRALIADMHSRCQPSQDHKGFSWPEQLNLDFVHSVETTVSFNYYADLFCMLFLAALYGPMDYRWEFGYLNIRTMVKATQSPSSDFSDSASCNGRLNKYVSLTRVTYDVTSIDERDYIACSEAISLREANEVKFGRSLPFRTIGDTVYISLTDERLDSRKQTEVSKMHARLGRSNSKWVLRDWRSTNGTLVVTRSGERIVVGGKGNETRNYTLANGDILCFGHNNERAVADLPCYLFQLCVDPKDMPTAEDSEC